MSITLLQLCPHTDHIENRDDDPRYVNWKMCSNHMESGYGSEDALVSLNTSVISGAEESGLETNRAYSEWMRKNRERKEKRRR